MKSIVILGSTGSIGASTLSVVRACPGQFRVVGLAARGNVAGVLAQAVEFGVRHVVLADPDAAAEARALAPAGVEVAAGGEAVAALAALPEADTVVCALVGMAGLAPVLSAIEAGHDVALATKEVLVAAGALVCAAAERTGARLMPIDSEHSALFQCLQSRHGLPYCVRFGSDAAAVEDEVRRLVLTASGGPFAGRDDLDFDTVTVAQALDHPRWQMGPKVTIDSATMMNKGLEVMEAQWLLNVPVDRIDVVVHPESIVHSMVEFVDASVLAQLSLPDMRLAIQYALTWPDRLPGGLPRLDLTHLQTLNFKNPEPARFPCLMLAREAARAGGTQPTVLNAANEIAVEAFLAGTIRFSGIWHTVEMVLERHDPGQAADLCEITEADRWAREKARQIVTELS